ncbi:phosphoribosylformylglycinamidine synthase II [Halovivax ruber XH-70]|uniref:Phosphoribosylformylglycinamidine synthase subunit PurL n=1 Tax=Halovivax ruber (strain DSM 18193 / JCM 13892 / XH-70) TaxID=797302 RepID=L0ICS1_HALRX|nr:phosphoribosylformylglycinamidine synthase subunit PurL [Halovivax ruber]AGB15757.1 phosphoribosylformylglycinamidine synthase II [Halovivax ruber XH-70]
MSLPESDRELIVDALGREPTAAESALFENLWSEHCAYRSSRPLLSAFESEGESVVVGPGDDAAVVEVPTADESDDLYLTLGIESHNHPSYVDPFDGAATGVGGIVRDTLSMGAYPIALADSLYFGSFEDEHSKYLMDGVVEGISHYGNCIGVPTVTGSADFHADYEGNPLVNVACVGRLPPENLITAVAQEPGNKLVLVGNATGRDGLGGASFASEDLDEDAETEDRPAVQVGDPYAEKLLIEANEVLVDEDLVESARDLGAAGLGGASSELVAKGGLGAAIDLDRVHQREPNMSPLEILLAESQERMCYEVRPEHVDRVAEVADRFDLGCSVIGEVTEGNYVCTYTDDAGEREIVVDVDAEFLGEGAPMNDLESVTPETPSTTLPDPAPALSEAFEAVVASPNTASKRWIYRQYDHEVGVRTSLGPGDDAAVLALPEVSPPGVDAAGDVADEPVGLAISAGAAPHWTASDPVAGAKAVALENATNLAAKGATPIAAVDCLNGGNPEKPDVYGGFSGIVDGLASMCETLSVPVVGGNVSLYNDSVSGPIPPTPTLAMIGSRPGVDVPTASVDTEGELLLIDADDSGPAESLGGSEYLAQFGGTAPGPDLPTDPSARLDAITAVAREPTTRAVHDISQGGLAVALAELCTPHVGLSVSLPEPTTDAGAAGVLFAEGPGRVLVQTTDPTAVRKIVGDAGRVRSLGHPTDDGTLSITVDDTSFEYTMAEIRSLRSTIVDALE